MDGRWVGTLRAAKIDRTDSPLSVRQLDKLVRRFKGISPVLILNFRNNITNRFFFFAFTFECLL